MKAVPILAYHSVSDAGSDEMRPYTLSPELFRAHIGALCDERYEVWSVSQICAAIFAGQALPRRIVGLTFDDAFADFANEAQPVITQAGLSATLYVPTAFVGRTSGWLTKAACDRRPVLTAEQLSLLGEAGIECGAHSHTHPQLDRLAKDLLEREVEHSKRALEAVVGYPVKSFAYPYGYYSRRVRRAVRKAGFQSACATGHSSAWVGSDLLALPRLLVFADTTADQLLDILAAASADPIRWRTERAKQWVYRAARRAGRGDGGRERSKAVLDDPFEEDSHSRLMA